MSGAPPKGESLPHQVRWSSFVSAAASGVLLGSTPTRAGAPVTVRAAVRSWEGVGVVAVVSRRLFNVSREHEIPRARRIFPHVRGRSRCVFFKAGTREPELYFQAGAREPARPKRD